MTRYTTEVERTSTVKVTHRFNVGDTVQARSGRIKLIIDQVIIGAQSDIPTYVVSGDTISNHKTVEFIDREFVLWENPRAVVEVDSATEVYDGYTTYGYSAGQSRSSLLTLRDGTKVFATQPAMVLLGDIIPPK
jgi:hypothetical protein